MTTSKPGGREWSVVLIVLLLTAQLCPAAMPPLKLRPAVSAVKRPALTQVLLPTGQLLTPAGRQVELPGMRPQVLALSPDGRRMATAGRAGLLVVLDAADGKMLQQLLLVTNQTAATAAVKAADPEEPGLIPATAAPATNNAPSPTNLTTTATNRGSSTNTNKPTQPTPAEISLTGLVFAPDGKHLYLSTVGGRVLAFPVDDTHGVGRPVAFTVPDARLPKPQRELPTGLAVSADSRRLYVAGNLANQLHELDAQTGRWLRSWATGVAPFDVALVGHRAYVSNLGGRRPDKGDLTAPAGKGTPVRVDPARFIASEGSITVIDLAQNTVKTELLVGLHPSALQVSPDRKYVVVANSGDDTLSVIDTGTDFVVEKIWVRLTPADLFGAQPNGLAFSADGRRLYVCNGTQNAVAVVRFEPETNASKVVGLVPVGWFPGAVQCDPQRKRLWVANLKGVGAAKVFKPGERVKLQSKDFYGTISLAPEPPAQVLPGLTQTVLRNLRYPRLAQAKLPPRPGQSPRPVPERLGEPSVFKHVIYVIKENRSYDQVLGDLPQGKGDTNLCTFGEKFTPNQHKIAREFVLLDNTYCAGIQSADGHQWTDSAIVNEYVERQITANSPRSYPSGKTAEGLDALAWSSSGFIWDNALAHGKSFRNYGEWMISDAGWRDKKRKGRIGWTNFWNDFVTGSNVTRLASHAGIASLRPYSSTNTVGWDLQVPDVMRVAAFVKELKQCEITGGFPALTLLFLPNDHTGGTQDRFPTPAAQVADNDLAFGQLVEAVSHSRFWPETCVLAIEDDPQAGWDHVSGYRTTCYVVSPYTKRRHTISTHYNQISLVRTLELMLGLPPMNQMDAAATPMYDCFTSVPDYRPFASVPNQVPLNQINPPPKKIVNPILRRDAILSARLRLDEPDRCPEEVLNRILWHAMKGPDAPYPRWAVKAVLEDD